MKEESRAPVFPIPHPLSLGGQTLPDLVLCLQR